MNATKKYQFTMLICMLLASIYLIIGIVFTIVNAIIEGYIFSVFILSILSFFAVMGQAKMMEVLGQYLKK